MKISIFESLFMMVHNERPEQDLRSTKYQYSVTFCRRMYFIDYCPPNLLLVSIKRSTCTKARSIQVRSYLPVIPITFQLPEEIMSASALCNSIEHTFDLLMRCIPSQFHQLIQTKAASTHQLLIQLQSILGAQSMHSHLAAVAVKSR